MYENKDKMDKVWINYCGMPVCFGWEEWHACLFWLGGVCHGYQTKMLSSFSFSSYTYSDPKKAPRTPKKEKGKSSDRDDLESIVGPSFKNKNLIEALKDFSPDFAASNECSSCKCQDCKVKHDGVINAINALATSVKKMTYKRGVIASKRISYPDTPLEIKAAKRRSKDTSKVDITATVEEHNMTIDNPSTTSKDKEKVKLVSLGERKNYPFEGFNISDEALKKLTQLINDYSEWIVDGLLKHHAGSDEFHWVSIVIVLKERRIRVYDSMSQRRRSGSSSEIQKMAKILPTYLDMSGFLDQKVRTNWSTIEAYRDKMANTFDVQYINRIAQQIIGSLDCGLFVVAYTEYLSDGLQVPNDGLDAGLLPKDMLLFYGNMEKQKLRNRTQPTLKIYDDQSRIP
ncbi:hypothetical protein T459_23212 [Capsicum annuum]|uniref:Ubiquitin-like protease family profile domain-containing protein n=1 Tax=Capsicum annuum TaxID=4072 RepID=A0A2G2YRP5_CAPAN|nr:hypothetical protein T459_23212 [Capsicum annuum]